MPRNRSRPTAKSVAEYLIRNFNPRHIEHLDDAIIAAIHKLQPDLSLLEAAEHCEREVQTIIRELYIHVDERISLQRYTPFSIQNDIIRGVDYDATHNTRTIRVRLIDVIDAVRRLQPRKFELFSESVAIHAGLTEVHPTRRTRDGGVDLIGFGATLLRGLTPIRMSVLVESKSERISVSEYRSFLGATDIARANANRLPTGVRLKPREPMLLAMFTAKDVTADVRREAERDGVAILEADHLAAIAYPYLNLQIDADTSIEQFISKPNQSMTSAC